jgi:type IV pilus assembly protein PilA
MPGPIGHPFFVERQLRTIMKQPLRRLSGSEGFTLVELLMVAAIIGVLGAIVAVSMSSAKMSANEASAVASLRAINTAEGAYSASAAAGGYAVELTVLATPCGGGTEGFISPDLAIDPARKSGYAVTLGAGSAGPGPVDCNGTASRNGYYLTAIPHAPGASGNRAFATSSRNIIFYSQGSSAPTEAEMDPGGGAQVVQ